MAVSHRTNRLKLIGTPAVEQLQNGRYQLTVNCTTMNSREDWYSSNKARIFPDFGSLESAEMSIDGLAPRTGEAYTDMRLVSVQSSTQQEKYIVTLVYQTLGASFVQVKDDTFNYVENGLRRVTRQSIAKAGTDFQKTVGTTSITSQIDGETAVTCVLANYEVDDTDSYREVTEVYIEAGTLSETEDKVGSQLAIVKETFASTPSTPSGYSIASEQESNVDGISTKRFTFLKPNILSVSQDFNNGQGRVSVQAFSKTSSEVTAALSEVTSDHTLISQRESDFAGIKTSTFEYQLDESFIQDREFNGLNRIRLIELSASDFTAQTIGAVSSTAPTSSLFLGSQVIDNGGTIKTRQSTWIEEGTLNVSTDQNSVTSEVVVNAIKLDAAAVRTAVSEVTANHNLKSQSTEDFAGLNSFRYVFEIRSTSTATELGDAQIGVKFETGIQTNGSSDFIITRQYAISSANTAASIKTLMPPAINDPIFDGTGGTQKAYLVDQEVTPNGLDGAVLTRTFAMLPTHLDEWDEMVIRFPGVNRGPFQLDEGFAFRSEPISEAVPVRMCRDFFLSNPQRICLPDEFRPVDENGNRVTVLTEDTVPTADEYIGFVNSGKYLNDRVSIHRWQGDIWERRIVQFRAQ